jgi:hypothetical protein
MRTLTIAFLLVLVAALTPAAQTQTRPNLGGKWRLMAEQGSARELAGLLVGICGQSCEIIQNDTTLSVKRTPPRRNLPTPDVFTIDWTQSRTLAQRGQGALPPPSITWTSTWKDATLIIASIETVPVIGGETKTETRHEFSLDDGYLKIQTTHTGGGAKGSFSPALKYQKVTDGD